MYTHKKVMWEHGKKAALYKPRIEALGATMPANALVLNFQALELGKQFLLLKPPSRWYFVRVASRLIQIISVFENLKSRLFTT